MAEKEAKKRKRNTLTPPIKSSPPPPSSPCSPPPPSSPSSLSSSPSSLSSSPSMWKCDICNFTCKLKARTQHIRGPGHQHKTFLAGQSCVCSSPFTSRLKPNLVGTNPSKKTEEPPQSEFNDMFCADCGFAFFLNRREFNALHAFPFYLDQCLSRSDIAPDQMKLILQQVLETISACSRKFSFHDPHDISQITSCETFTHYTQTDSMDFTMKESTPPQFFDDSLFGHTGYAANMGEAEPTALYPGTYYLCFEKNGGSVLRMDRPRTDTIKFGIVFVADPRRICDARHFDMKKHKDKLWKTMLIYAMSGFVDGYCLVPPHFKLEDLKSYELCAGREDGLLMFIEKGYFQRKKHIKQTKHIRLSEQFVTVVHIVPIEKSNPETTVLLSPSEEPKIVSKDHVCKYPLPTRFCPPWEETKEFRKKKWRCMRLLLSVHQTIPHDPAEPSPSPSPSPSGSSRRKRKGFFKIEKGKEEKERWVRKEVERLREEEKRLRMIDLQLKKMEEERMKKEEERLKLKEEKLIKEEEQLQKEKEEAKLRKVEEKKKKKEEEERVKEEIKKERLKWEEESRLRKEEKERFEKELKEEREKIREKDRKIQELEKKGEEEERIKRERDDERKRKRKEEENDLREELKTNSFKELFREALKEDDVKRVQLLLEMDQSADIINSPFFPPYGNSALHFAAKNGYKQIVELLLDRGAIVDILNEGGNTPLHHVAYYGKDQVAKILLEKQANLEIQNMRGETPLDIAVTVGDNKVIEILKRKKS